MNDTINDRESGRSNQPLTFEEFGLDHVAYVRRIATAEGPGFSIHAANGQQIAIADDMATAFGFIVQNEMEPVSLH